MVTMRDMRDKHKNAVLSVHLALFRGRTGHADGIEENNEIRLRMKAITKLPIFVPDFLLHAL